MAIRKIIVIVGTRPEAVKMLPLYLALKKDATFQTLLLATAQHRQLLDQVLEVFGVRSDIDLDLMEPNQTLGGFTARALTAIQGVLAKEKPDAVLVHGDTTTCLSAAIAAFYERIAVGHVEAGLRTYDFSAPFPEEMNRRLVDPICRWCFAPTERAAADLRAERIAPERIFVTGNTGIDGLLMMRQRVGENPPPVTALPKGFPGEQRMILVTGHRRESFGKPFEEFCWALRDVVERHADTVLVYPVHLNPNVRKPVNAILGNVPRVHLIEPVDYLEFVHLMNRSYLIITDSGGIQEEAPSLHKPLLVTRTTTERPEAVNAGLALLVGTDRERIVTEASRLLSDANTYSRMSCGQNPYGDGKASERICQILRQTL